MLDGQLRETPAGVGLPGPPNTQSNFGWRGQGRGAYAAGMAFDEDLARRVRAVLGTSGVTPTEKKMFGGLSFLVNGNMCCGVMGPDLLARVGPKAAPSALAEPSTRPFDMGRGPSAGWVVVGQEAVTTDEALTSWVDRSLAYAASLPPK